MTIELLKELTEAPGIPGREEIIRDLVARELKGVVKTLKTDVMGNLIAFRPGSSKKPTRVMYAAHMDEIGFIVKHIDDHGFIRLNPVGGHDPRNTVIQRMRIHGKQTLIGVVSCSVKPVHIQSEEDKKKGVALDDLFVDVGLPVAMVKELVSVGDMATLCRESLQIGKRFTGKSMDNRTAVYSLIQALKRTRQPLHDTYAVFTVQEEVGLRGAMTASYEVNPEISVALDTTLACDVPGTDGKDVITRLGDGVGLTVMDGSMISDYTLLKEFQALAEHHKIKHQMNILPRGGTDAGSMQRARDGSRAITISLPTRYIHSSIETIDLDDLEAKISLIAAYMKGK